MRWPGPRGRRARPGPSGCSFRSCGRTRPEIDAAFPTMRSQRAATYVDKILKGKPADQSVEQPTNHQPFGRITMTIYEMRTYTLHVGKMGEAVKLYTELGYPALQKGGQGKKVIGYFQADTGMVNQLVHLWKFDDDADRRAHWAAVFANKDFVEGFALKFRPLLVSQEVKLLTAALWGPHP